MAADLKRDLKQEVARHLPYLRRYARAITGSQEGGDSLVVATLRHLLGRIDDRDVKLALYRGLHDVLQAQEAGAQAAGDEDHVLANAAILAYRIEHLTPARRQMLLLTSLEGFSLDDAARIMRLEPTAAAMLLDEAKADLRSQSATRILIIEDEPIIALDIAHTVERSGHTVVGFASTHKEAVALAREHRPELILADIQLADDSSGLEAVREILGQANVPVIFITAFPERLLSGERPEPTFLITKPFDTDTLHVSISQALAMAGLRGQA